MPRTLKRTATRLWVALTAAVLVGGVVVSTARPASAVSHDNLNRSILSTVQLITPVGDTNSAAQCSATVVDPSGYILTNVHCVGVVNDDRNPPPGLRAGDLYNPKGLVAVAPTLDAKKVPVPTYVARVLSGTPELDIAVIKIIGTLDRNGAAPAPESLPLVVQPMGDSDAVQPGDEVTVIGYPGIGGPLVTVTSGKVSGFDDRNGDGTIDSIKTDASITHGNSGGLAIDEQGRQIGIPTWGLEEGASKLDRLMMINLAVPYIEQAIKVGNADQGSTSGGQGTTGTVTPPGGGPSGGSPFGQLHFATDVSPQGQLVSEGTTFPSGAKQVLGAWLYKGISRGTPWGYQFTFNGQVAIDKRNTESWDEASEGGTFVRFSSDGGLPDGSFEMALFVNDREVQRGNFTVGAGAQQGPLKPQKPQPPSTQGVVISGSFADADTGQPIPGALFVVLKPGVSPEQFVQNPTNDQVAAAGQADESGAFRTAPPLPRGQTYSVLIGANGYQPRTFDNILELGSDAPAVVSLDQPLVLRKR
jgi:S1-C subfamily serine protease